MRGFVLACALAVVAAQNASLYSFSGNFPSGAATINPSYTSTSDGLCYSYTSSDYYYTTFNYTFATAGVYAIYGFNLAFVGVVKGPASINVSDLCASTPAVFPLRGGDNYNIGAEQSYGHWFENATYTFVVGSGSSGPFGGEIWNGWYNGEITGTGANKTWSPVYDSSGCYEYGSASLYDAQLATVATSGYYQVFLAWAQNRNLDPSYQVPYSNPMLTVLKGDYTGTDLTTADCSTFGTNYVYGQQGDELTVQLFDIWLNAGQNYTFIATGGYQSSSGSYVGHYTIILTPGKTLYFTNTTLFNRPSYGSCDPADIPSDCEDYSTPNKGQAYSYTTFTVPKNTWFYIYAQQGDGKDLEFFIYNEFNTLLLACGTLGQTCQYTEDSINGETFFSGNSDKFTIVATNYFTDYFGSEAFFTFYLLNGPALPGYFISSAPTAPTAAAPSAAAPTAPTNAAGPTAPTNKAPSAPTAPTAPTNKAPTAPTAKATGVNGGAVAAPCLAMVAAAAFLA